ncbi:MAG: hypothetical protein Q7R85_03340 [bacterium]|nr:hypothetical protein [bacterium]
MKTFLVALVITLAIVVGYFILHKPATQSTISIATSGWQTYVSDQYGFELKYPDIAAYLKTLDGSWLVGGGNAPIIVPEIGFNYGSCVSTDNYYGPGEPVKSKRTVAGREFCLVATNEGGAAGSGGTKYEYVTHVGDNDVGIVFEVVYRLSENFDA